MVPYHEVLLYLRTVGTVNKPETSVSAGYLEHHLNHSAKPKSLISTNKEYTMSHIEDLSRRYQSTIYEKQTVDQR